MFISISTIYNSSFQTFKRFPFVVFTGILAAALFIAIDYYGSFDEILIKIAYAVLLGLPLFTALKLFAENNEYDSQQTLRLNVYGVLALALYLASVFYVDSGMNPLRFLQLNVAAHLLVSVLPFWNSSKLEAFWQYNKILFFRICLSTLFSGVLFGGLAGALGSVDYLLGFDVDGDAYYYLWFFIIFIFHPWFFLSGIPSNLNELDKENNYSSILRYFAQYLLLSLVIVYLLILYAYSVKILATFTWPKGTIGWLITGVSITGIFTLLLLYPYKNLEKYTWIKKLYTFYFLAVIPLLILLFLAIWRRVSDYGLTEKRYFLIALGLWLLGIAVYQLFKRNQNIKIIPQSLLVITLVTSFGPWGAYSVSENNQIARLKEVLVKSNILQNEKIVKQNQIPDFEINRDVSSALRYLKDYHSFDKIKAWFPKDNPIHNLESNCNSLFYCRNYYDLNKILTPLGLEYTGRWRRSSKIYYNFNAKDYYKQVYDIKGYDYLHKLDHYTGSRNRKLNDIIELKFYFSENKIFLYSLGEKVIEIDLNEKIDFLMKQYKQSSNYNIVPENMVVSVENERAKIKLHLERFNIIKDDNGKKINSINGMLLVSIK